MIPRIDVRSLAAKKMDTGELTFEFEAVDLLDIPFTEFSAPVQVTAEYEIFGDNKVEVQLRFTFTLKGACSRCLSAAEQTFTENAAGVFEPGTGDGESYGYTNFIDLTEFVRDSLAFALPAKLLCAECQRSEAENE